MSSVGSSEGGALGSSGTGKAPEQGDHDAFYDTDGVTTTTPGEILKTETVPYNPAPRGMKGYVPKTVDRIMYTTTNAHGELTPVTGYIMEPRTEWKGKGERPTVIIGRGTVGQGDKCAPTRNWPLHNLQDPVQSGRGVNLEGIYDVAFAKYGVRVIVTDYIGMGTDEVHTYMNRLDQAHAMIDAGRAARNIVEKNGGKFGKVAFYGHSQGGGASTAAVEEAPNYGKDLDVAGAYASAPPADLNAVQQNIDGSDLMGAIGFTINGMLARYPELRPLLEEHLNEEGPGRDRRDVHRRDHGQLRPPGNPQLDQGWSLPDRAAQGHAGGAEGPGGSEDRQRQASGSGDDRLWSLRPQRRVQPGEGPGEDLAR